MSKFADQNVKPVVQSLFGLSAPTGALRLTPLRTDHLLYALGLSHALGWPYREEDWRFAFDLGAGFAVEAESRLVATGLWWPQGVTHASVGMIIVDPQMQGRGIGRALMDALLQQAGERTVLLNSTQEGLALYTQLGFVAHSQINQHQALLEPEPPRSPRSQDVRLLQAADEKPLRQLDLDATARDRTALLDALLESTDVMVVDCGAGVSAYACVREFGHGVVIGPVIAKGPHAMTDAMSLIAAFADNHRGRFVRIDVTEESGLSQWLTELGLPCVGHARPMVRGLQPRAGTDARLFALSNQSIG